MADIAYNAWVTLADDQAAATAAPTLVTDGFDITAAEEIYLRVAVNTATSWAAILWLWAGVGPTWEPLADSAMSGGSDGDTICVRRGPATRAYLQLTAVAGGHVDLEAFLSKNRRVS